MIPDLGQISLGVDVKLGLTAFVTFAVRTAYNKLLLIASAHHAVGLLLLGQREIFLLFQLNERWRNHRLADSPGRRVHQSDPGNYDFPRLHSV